MNLLLAKSPLLKTLGFTFSHMEHFVTKPTLTTNCNKQKCD
ncbi:unnamed protein product [Arabidopsis halleri]